MITTAAQQTPAPRTPGRRPHPVTLIAVLVGVVPFAVHAVAAVQGYFGHDDFVLFHRAAVGGFLDPGYLFQDYNGHIAPGMFLLASIVTEVAPLSRVHAVIPLLLVQAFASVLLWRLLVRCFGTRWALLPVFAAFTFCPLVLYPTLWWAAAVQALPLLLAMFGALHAHVRYLQDGERRHVVATVVWTVAGMAFFEKAVLFIGLFLAVTVLLARPGERWALGRHWRVWVVHGAVAAVFLALYVGLTTSQVKDKPLSQDVVADFIRRAVVGTLIPGLLGGPWTDPVAGGQISTPPLALRVTAICLAVAVVVAGLLIGRARAALAWSALLVYLVIDLTLVMFTRLHQVGPLIGHDPRYLVDVVPVAVFCTAFAFLRPGGRNAPGHGTKLIAVGLAVALGTSATYSFVRLAPGLQFRESRTYVANARAALEADPGMSLYDTAVPREIVHEWFARDAMASRVIGLLPGPPRFDQPAEAVYMLDGTGTPRKIQSVRSAVLGRPGPYQDCGYRVGYQTATIPLSGRVDGRRLLRLEYYTSAAGPVTIRVGRTSTDIHFKKGLYELYVVVDGSFDRVDINRATQVDPLCLVDLRIGDPSTTG